MPETFNRSAAPQSPLKGLLEALSRLEQLPAAQAPQRPAIDPEKARRAVLHFLERITAEDEEGKIAREALHRLTIAARDLLRLVAGHEA